MCLLHILYHLIWATLLISDFRSTAQWPVKVHIALFIYSLHYFHLISSQQWQKPSDHLNTALHNWSHQQTAVSRHQNGTPHCSYSVINTQDRRPKSTVAKTLTIGDKLDRPQKKQHSCLILLCKCQCFHDMRQLWMGLCHKGDVTNNFRSWINLSSFRISNFRGTFLVSNIHSSPLQSCAQCLWLVTVLFGCKKAA